MSKKLSLIRLWKLSTMRHTIYRSLVYEILQKLNLSGVGIDVGGGANANYKNILQFDRMYSLNIDSAYKPSVIADINLSLPFIDNSFDFVLSVNTLEHIYNDTFAITEIERVLKPHGDIHIIVPFMFNVHGSPNDYHRHTNYFWSKFLYNLNMININIVPIQLDISSMLFLLYENYIKERIGSYIPRQENNNISHYSINLNLLHKLKNIIKRILIFFYNGFWALLKFLVLLKCYLKFTIHLHDDITKTAYHFTMGYYIHAQKGRGTQ